MMGGIAVLSIGSEQFGELPVKLESWMDRLVQAVEWWRYPTLYALLRRPERELSASETFQLCSKALENGMTAKSFSALLDHGPPLMEVLSKGKQNWDDGLVEKAAARDRVDILNILLSRGGNVNRLGSGRSPLEAAVEGCALHSVERLLQEPELDVTLTKRLLKCWSLADTGRVGLDFCLQAAAPRLLGKNPGLQDPIPIPDQLTISQTVESENWALVRRLCKERGLSQNEGRAALKRFEPPNLMLLEPDPIEMSKRLKTEIMESAAALDSMFTACPKLVQGRQARLLLVIYTLQYPEENWSVLAPWLAQIQDQTVLLEEVLAKFDFDVMCPRDLRWSSIDPKVERTLSLWQTYMPKGPRPAISRHGVNAYVTSGTVDLIFQRCVLLWGKKPEPGEVSRLAADLLQWGGPELIEAQFKPGGLLAEEDPGALLQFCQKRKELKLTLGVVLNNINQKEEEVYEL